MVVIIYYYIGYKYKATTWYLNGFPNGSNLESTVVFTLKTVLTSIQYLLFLTLQGKETNFRGYKLTHNKVQKKDSIAVAMNSRSMIFVTIVSYVRWCVCVFDPIYSGVSLRLSVYGIFDVSAGI